MNIVMTKLGNIEGIMSAFIPKVKSLNSLFSRKPSETALPLKAVSDGLDATTNTDRPAQRDNFR